jgi:hypothetical protein
MVCCPHYIQIERKAHVTQGDEEIYDISNPRPRLLFNNNEIYESYM